MNHLDQAIDAYKQTVELFPDYPQAHLNLATVYGLKKMYKEALAEYQILAEIDPAFRAELEQRMKSMKNDL